MQALQVYASFECWRATTGRALHHMGSTMHEACKLLLCEIHQAPAVFRKLLCFTACFKTCCKARHNETPGVCSSSLVPGAVGRDENYCETYSIQSRQKSAVQYVASTLNPLVHLQWETVCVVWVKAHNLFSV